MEEENNTFDFFKDVQKRELTSTEKVQELEELVHEIIRDLALSRDEAFIDSLKEDTQLLVRKSEEHFKKFKHKDKMYISIPEKLYDKIEPLNDFEKYNKVMEYIQLSISAPEYRELDEEGNLKYTEAELINQAAKNYTEKTGIHLDIDHLIERDDYDQPSEVKEHIFEPKKYVAVKTNEDGEEKHEPDEDEKAAEESQEEESEGESEGKEITKGHMSMQEVNDEVEQEKQEIENQISEREYEAEYTSQSLTEIDRKTLDTIKGSTFDKSCSYGSVVDPEFGILSKKDVFVLNKYANDIEKSLKGYLGKIKRLNPSKRLSSKDICSDNNDKIYIGKSMVDGKKIDMNVISEFSGSMDGDPARNAIKLFYLFNKLAQKDIVEGHMILTESRENIAIKMPVPDELIFNMGGTGSAEGIAKGIEKHKEVLRHKNAIVMTDGDICEEPIDKRFWDINRINCIGVYVNEKIEAEKLPGYDKNLTRWFPKKIVRNSFESLVQKIIQLGLKASK